MARRHTEEEPENHERWLVSYADFITLLFAFFVVMYAISSVNEGKYRVLSNSLGTAFGKPPAGNLDQPGVKAPPPLLPRGRNDDQAIRREKEQLTAIARDILKVLAPLVAQGKVKVTQGRRGVVVEINASVLFGTGEAKLTPESVKAMSAVAQVVKDDHHLIQVEGHTDNIPIATAAYPSNWELSSARASSVVRLFIENGVDEKRLSAVGHGPNQQVDSNDTAAGRQRNRRVQLMILSALPEVVKELEVR